MSNFNKEWDGRIHIISDKRFFAMLTDTEYQVYCGLRTLAHNTDKTKGRRRFDYFHFNGFSELSEELELVGRKEGSKVTRDTLRNVFKKLISEGVIVKSKEFEKEVYEIIDHNKKEYMFAKIDKELMKTLTKCLKGNTIKTYVYIKAIYDNNNRQGNETKINRETIAKAINEVSKDGEIKERQLKNISAYLKVIYNLGLIDMEIDYTVKDGTIESSIIHILDVNEKLKKIPRGKSKKRA